MAGHGWDASKQALPAWSLPKDAVERISLPAEWPERVTRQWAFGGSTGKGARVCILDSGVDASHPLVGGLDSAVAISLGENEETIADEDTEGDVSGQCVRRDDERRNLSYTVPAAQDGSPIDRNKIGG